MTPELRSVAERYVDEFMVLGYCPMCQTPLGDLRNMNPNLLDCEICEAAFDDSCHDAEPECECLPGALLVSKHDCYGVCDYCLDRAEDERVNAEEQAAMDEIYCPRSGT